MSEARQTSVPLQALHHSQVGEAEIDSLGHLSVPFYAERSLAASNVLLEASGLTSGESAEGVNNELVLVDSFMRNYREQFLGARLIVQGGVIDVSADRVRLYHELINPERDELSATFVHAFERQVSLATRTTRTTLPLGTDLVERLEATLVDWPDHGRSRSLDLSQPPFHLDLASARERNLKARPSRQVDASECDASGFLQPARFPHLPYSGSDSGGEPQDSESDWVFEFEGRRLGLADLESRTALVALPRSGDRIQAFSADVALARKTVQRNHWVINPESGELLTAGAVVMALLDLDARRVVEISGALRSRFEADFHPDLA